LELAKEHPNLFDFRHIAPGRDGFIPGDHPSYLSLPNMVRAFAFVLDIGGNGYSGRLKYLLFSKRPLFIVEREFVQFFHADLVAFTHFIPVHEDLSNLVSQMEWALAHLEQVHQIALNAFEYATANLTHERFLKVLADTMNAIIQDA
jgi:hypothetical protein